MRLWETVAILAVALAWSGCGGLATGESAKKEVTIGPAGGPVRLDTLTLTIPEGALTEDVTIVVKKVSEHPAGNVGPVYLVEAAGLDGPVVFLQPVVLSLAVPQDKLADGVEPADLRLAWVHEEGWEILGESKVVVEEMRVTGQTLHLSLWGVVVQEACENTDDCSDGKNCVSGVCVAPPTCDAGKHVPADVLEAARQCFLSTDHYMADQVKGQAYYPAVSLAGFTGKARYSVRTLLTATSGDGGDTYELQLPCKSLSVALTGTALNHGALPGGVQHVVPLPCSEGEQCDCDHCVTAVATIDGVPRQALGGRLRLRCPPASDDCPPFAYCFETLELDLGDVDGKRWWLRLKSDQEERLPEDEWTQAMQALAEPSVSCPFELSAELSFYDNICFGVSVRCNGEHQLSACTMLSGDDTTCKYWTVDGAEGAVIGQCDLANITCEKPEVWDMRYAFDAPAGECEFCFPSDDTSPCVPLDVQCGGWQQLEPQVASGSAEAGPHPMMECTDWAVCPPELGVCYADYPEGSECYSGRMNVRFTRVPFGGEEICSDAVPGEGEPTECLYYYDGVSNPTWCCNGYVANKSTWIMDEISVSECCAEALESWLPGVEIAQHIDESGRFNYGLPLSEDYDGASPYNLVCMEWFSSIGTSWSGYIHSDSGLTAAFYQPEIVELDGGSRVRCDPSADPLPGSPAALSTLDISPGTTWETPDGESCDDLQEFLYTD